MPLARLSLPSTLSLDKARQLAEIVHDGLVTTCNVPLKDRFQLITFFASDHMFIDPNFPDVNRTVEASIIEILFLEGRTQAQKSGLFQHIATNASQIGFAGDDIMVVLTENATTDWSLGYGRTYGDAHKPDA